ncbi:MAG TPA: THUMP domain-containing protein [Oligoflexus sp.]|uniref:THUMP domain-containing class I SAM-dependent RNA methyltransferase n=1 Tax=Oligoflexus sp. TaxID=1971216 RepID=UPI002D72DD77|nr:THUMP domain-containing protein [Oligoflexus sp.]HYX36947.1 THUMP domain-containing protein [Oligoflexus sp.]
MNASYIAICSQDIIDATAQELESHGASKVEKGYKAVYFEADQELAYRLHLMLQTPSRILEVVRRGGAGSLAVVTNQARKVKWEEYFRPDSTYLVEGVAGDRGPNAPTGTLISKAVRLGLEDAFRKMERPLPTVDLKEPKIKVVAFLLGGELTISVDSSGKSMHKRGYRGEGHPAPIKENLAAGLLRLAGFDGTQNLYDPMCGSGTIAIEGAFMALEKAPLIHRKKGQFGFENFAKFDAQLWRKVQDACRAERLTEPKAGLFASDISRNYIDAARENALRARVEKYIQFRSGSFFDLKAPAETGLLISNFPYGERIGKRDEEELINFYKKVGDTLKQKYAGWTAALLVGEDTPYKFIGLRPRRKIPIDNGGIPCRLLLFSLYAGKKYSGPEE